MAESREGTAPLRASPLGDLHRQLGAKLVPFAGWELPLHYPGKAPVSEEHLAVRRDHGLFDVSHMARIAVEGPGALPFLELVCTADLTTVAPGTARYTLLLEERGYPIDDLLLYRLDEGSFLLVANAANRARVVDWLRRHLGPYQVAVEEQPPDRGMVAVQGPRAEQALAAVGLPTPPRGGVAAAAVGGAQVLVCATGYTGERGFELIGEAATLKRLWQQLVEGGARPAGLAARDSLRIEAGLPLYGNELTEDRCPLTVGLERFIRPSGGFIGADQLLRRAEQLRNDPEQGLRIAQFVAEPGPIPRAGDRVITVAGSGIVTSGTFSPLLGRPVGLAYLPARAAVPGQEVEIEVRGRIRRAEVVKRPAFRNFPAYGGQAAGG